MMSNLKQEYEALGGSYSKAHGTFLPIWNTNVDLSTPKKYRNTKTPVEDQYTKDYYDTLQYTLLETDHPETIDRSATPRTRHNPYQVTVAIISSPHEIIGLLLEGGKQVPDAFHLILSTTWISKLTDDGKDPKTSIYVHKAITFHTNGQTYVDVFTPPRKATYFLNFFTNAITAGQRNDGEEYEEDLDCPMSSCVELSELVDNKIWTRTLMADIGIAYPITLAFMYRPHHVIKNNHRNLTLIELEYKSCAARIAGELSSFLTSHLMKGVKHVVVKPSGPDCYGSMGVTFHDKTDESSILQAVLGLITDIKPGYSVLVEEFIQPLQPIMLEESASHRLWGASEDISFRLRATVYRDFNDKPLTTMINCGMQDKSRPINGDNTVTQSLDSTLLAYNIVDHHERQALKQTVKGQCEQLLARIIDEETIIKSRAGGKRAQTEVIGVDFVVREEEGHLVPVCIEANSHDCTINCQIYEFVQNLYNTRVACSRDPQTYLGESYLPWIRNIMVRSQRYVMEDKLVVVVGSGGFSKRYIWPECQRYRIKVILIDADAKCYATDHVYHFIHYIYDDHSKDRYHAANIKTILDNNFVYIDGCLTFWEDCGPLAALLREELQLSNRGVNFEAATIAKKKSRTLEVLRSRKDDTPHWPRAYLYSSASHIIHDEETLRKATNEIKFPAVLKMEHGSSAVGVSLVHNTEDLRQQYDVISSTMTSEQDFPGIGLGFDNSMLVMEYHAGSEHDVDVVIFDRKLVAAFISDNGPTKEPIFLETASTMPSVLPKDKQAQLVAAAYQSCIEIGLTNGTFNVELKMTSIGPKLIEINARMGGFYLRDWIKRLYDVDLALVSIMVACGIKPYIPRRVPSHCIMGIMLVPSLHKHIFDDVETNAKLKSLVQSGEVIWNQFSATTESINAIFEEPFGNIAIMDVDRNKARNRLVVLCEELGISSQQYVAEFYTSYFI